PEDTNSGAEPAATASTTPAPTTAARIPGNRSWRNGTRTPPAPRARGCNRPRLREPGIDVSAHAHHTELVAFEVHEGRDLLLPDHGEDPPVGRPLEGAEVLRGCNLLQ